MMRATALLAAALGATTLVALFPPVPATAAQRGPAQPILFPHDTHAGKLGMNCLFCHWSAERSPISNLPAVSTCMGCHKIAMTDRPEVQKLAGYWNRGETIPWVEVYWLPDYVKFNHERHVRTGMACQMCHGPVERMHVVYRYASLKMGWCVECHRKWLRSPKHPAPMDCFVCHNGVGG